MDDRKRSHRFSGLALAGCRGNAIPIKECTFIADMGYDAKVIYNAVRYVYQGEAVIPLNKRNTKAPAKLPIGKAH